MERVASAMGGTDMRGPALRFPIERCRHDGCDEPVVERHGGRSATCYCSPAHRDAERLRLRLLRVAAAAAVTRAS